MKSLVELGKLPNKDALKYWQQKMPLDAGMFYQLADQYRSNAFTISGLNSLKTLQNVQNSLGESLKTGETFASWKKGVLKDFKDVKRLGSHQLKTVYANAFQASYSAGRYERMTQLKGSRPYWQYDAMGDGRTRPAHRALSGKVFPVDHPFWDTWFPPNGHRCRCAVRSFSKGDLERKKLVVEKKTPTMFEPTDPNTGAKLPAQPLVSAPGWGVNQAKSAKTYLNDLELKTLEGVDLKFAKAYILNKNRHDPTFEAFTKGEEPGTRPVAVLDPETREAIGADTQIVRLSDQNVRYQTGEIKHPEMQADDYLEKLQLILDQGEIVSDQREGYRGTHYIFIKNEGNWYSLALKRTQSGKAIYVLSYRLSSLGDTKRHRRNGEIKRKEKK